MTIQNPGQNQKNGQAVRWECERRESSQKEKWIGDGSIAMEPLGP